MENLNLTELLFGLWLYRWLIGPLLTVMVLSLLLKAWWSDVRYFFLNVRYGFPILGRIARVASKPQTRERSTGSVNWYTSEKALCAAYAVHYNSVKTDGQFYRKSENYLRKVDELGRNGKGPLLWFGTVALVVFEAVGFAYVLAPYMVRNVSANTATMLAWMIAFMLAIILVPTTHLMGLEIHRNGLLQKARTWFDNERKDGHAKELRANSKVTLENTFADDNEPNYIQIINRVPHNASVRPRWYITVIGVLLIAFIAIGAYKIRALTVEDLETEQVNASPFSQSADVPLGAQTPALELPAAAQDDNKAADKKAAAEVLAAKLAAYKLTFVILSVIFVGVQVVGVLIGLLCAFAGSQSKAAARYIRGFNNADEFEQYQDQKRERIARDAQAKLHDLQERVERRHDTIGDEHRETKGSFHLYLEEMELEHARRDERKRQRTRDEQFAEAQRSAAERTQREAPAPVAPHAEGVAAGQSPVNETVAGAPRKPTPGATEADSAQPASVSNTTADAAARIATLGDLTKFSEEQLARMAVALNIDATQLNAERELQQVIARARQA